MCARVYVCAWMIYREKRSQTATNNCVPTNTHTIGVSRSNLVDDDFLLIVVLLLCSFIVNVVIVRPFLSLCMLRYVCYVCEVCVCVMCMCVYYNVYVLSIMCVCYLYVCWSWMQLLAAVL